MKCPIPVRRAVQRMRPYHPPLEGRSGKLRLDFNENTVGCSPAVRRALAGLTPDQIAMYPEYETACRCLAKHFRVRPDELILTNGTDDALRLVVDTFVNPGDRVLLVEPTFAMYRFYAELAGAHVVSTRYDDEMRFPMSSVLRALRSRPRVLFLANPNNPTGTLLGRDELQRILQTAAATLVVVDEAYFEFSKVTVLPWVRRFHNLVVTRTFSKAAGMGGLRLGCLFVNPSLAEHMRKAHSPYPVNAAALMAAQAAVRDSSWLQWYAAETNKSKRRLYRAFAELGIKSFPSGGNFILVDFGHRAPDLVEALRRRGILVRDRQNDFGRAGFVRITAGTRAQTEKFLKALRALWRQKPAPSPHGLESGD